MEIDQLFAKTNICWTTREIAKSTLQSNDAAAIKKIERRIQELNLDFPALDQNSIADEHERHAKQLVVSQVLEQARKKTPNGFVCGLT